MDATTSWWSDFRSDFLLFTSRPVIDEAEMGDAEIAAQRLAILATIAELPVTAEAEALAIDFLRRRALPPKARIDALHIAVAAANGINYLLTWNCRHLANVRLRPGIEQTCRDHGFEPPLICTPLELTEEQ